MVILVFAVIVVIVIGFVIIVSIVVGIVVRRVVISCSNFTHMLAFSASKLMCCGGGVMGR